MPMLCQSVAMLITSQFLKTSGSYTSILLDIQEYYKPYINKYKTVVTVRKADLPTTIPAKVILLSSWTMLLQIQKLKTINYIPGRSPIG